MGKLELSIADSDGVRRILVDGFVDYDHAKEFNKGFQEAIAPGVTRVVLDFSKLTLINSLGITLILEASKKLQAAGGTLVIEAPSAAVLKLLRTLRLDKVLTLTTSPEESRRHFAGASTPAAGAPGGHS